ncbi:MAG: hypothetical protein HYY20_04970 [Candidatus Tectomicrobia bacterium]|uniref:Uncharacterized protein n=1 Tax=Tectimicrobiota bacterium TaxID=2528274 RepID=A0A932CN66_UNCTE|nr:hypothetical protein [Candidatus Tectomicrobia bacterium]
MTGIKGRPERSRIWTALMATWLIVAATTSTALTTSTASKTSATILIEFVDRYRDDKGGEKASIGGRVQGIEDFDAYKVLVYTTLDNQIWIRAPGQYAPLGPGGTWERWGLRPGKRSRIFLIKRGVKVPSQEALTQKELEGIARETELTHTW